jgi:Flp pilus assembly protein CpaB
LTPQEQAFYFVDTGRPCDSLCVIASGLRSVVEDSGHGVAGPRVAPRPIGAHTVSAAPPRVDRNGRSSRPTAEPLVPLGVAPAARPSRWRWLRGWLTLRLIGGLAVMLVAFCGYLLLLLLTTPRADSVVVLTRDLPAGARLAQSDLASAAVQLPDAQAVLAIASVDADQLIGRTLVAPVVRDEVLIRPALAATDAPELEPGYQAVTLPVRPDTAVSGALQLDDRVRVVVTTNKGPAAQSHTILPSARVLVIGRGTPGGAGGLGTSASATAPARTAQPIASVTLSVPADVVETLTAAKYAGEVDLVRIGVASTSAGSAAN